MDTHEFQSEESYSSQSAFYHIVYFWVKPETSSERVQQLIDDCKSYLGSINTVRELHVGTPAGTPRDVVDNSFAVNLIVRFDDKAGHDYYQEIDTHQQFIDRNKEIWQRVQVYDMIKK